MAREDGMPWLQLREDGTVQLGTLTPTEHGHGGAQTSLLTVLAEVDTATSWQMLL